MPNRIPNRNHYTSLNLKSTFKYSYCDKTSYTEDRCYKKHGYPDDKGKGKGRTSDVNRAVALVLRKLPYAPTNNVSKTPTSTDD
jgi:hypothetical protein